MERERGRGFGQQPARVLPGELLPERGRYLYRAYQIKGKTDGVICFFRDERLSDMIGFEYSKWFGRDAADHLVHSLEDISRNAIPGEKPIVSMILDGENAWEYYPYNGYYFLNDLYEILENHAVIRPTTYRDYIESVEHRGCRRVADFGCRKLGLWNILHVDRR